MLKLALAFFVAALVAAVFGYGGLAAGVGAVLRILFWAFVMFAALALMAGLTERPTRDRAGG